MNDKIVSATGFGVENTANTQCNYMVVAVTESGKVLISEGDCGWCDISPKEPQQKQPEKKDIKNYKVISLFFWNIYIHKIIWEDLFNWGHQYRIEIKRKKKHHGLPNISLDSIPAMPPVKEPATSERLASEDIRLVKTDEFRSQGRKINQDADMVRVTLVMSKRQWRELRKKLNV